MTWSRRRSEEVIERVAQALEPLQQHNGYKFVFLGGTTVALYVTDKMITRFRPTIDVDVVVGMATRTEYDRLENQLRDAGFTNDRDVICRWKFDDLIVDIMPSSGAILGFGGRWYPHAVAEAVPYQTTNRRVHIPTPPCFLATKLEAFAGRGRRDYAASRDLEDIVTVIDGRPEIVSEVSAVELKLNGYLTAMFSRFLSDRRFVESLPGHLAPDPASQLRLPLLLERIKALAGRRR